MRRLLKTGSYNAGLRPSEYHIGEQTFNRDNGGSIPPNVIGAEDLPALGSVLRASNTRWNEPYQAFCRDRKARVHPARMQRELAEFFLRFLTDEDDLVLDPFAGSNTTGELAEASGRRWLSIEATWEHAANSIGRFNPADIETFDRDLKIARPKASLPHPSPVAEGAANAASDLALLCK
jgi:site-specific DNA-methyltransferase (cytosine-N4-specific)